MLGNFCTSLNWPASHCGGPGLYVVDGGEILGANILAQLVDHFDEDHKVARWELPVAVDRAAGAASAVVGAEDERHGVEQ